MKKFRIYTEDVNSEKTKELVSICFDGFNVTRTKGYWKGKAENSAIIEIFTDNEPLIRALCEAIKKNNKQEAVGLTIEPVDFILI